MIPVIALLFLLPQDSKAKGETVEFQLHEGIVLVRARINGQGPFSLIFDTATPVTVIRPHAAARLGLDKGGAAFLKLDSVELGSARATDIRAIAAERLLTLKKATYDGVLGYDVISRFVVTLDYKKKTLRLEPSDYTPEDTTGLARLASDKPATAGFMPAPLSPDQANEIGVDGGVLVRKILKGGPADQGGLREGDLIQEINGRRIDTVEEYQRILRVLRPGDLMAFTVIRDKKDVEVRVTLGERN